MTTLIKISLIAINKWLFHGWNYKSVPLTLTKPNGEIETIYVPEFIKEVKWTCNLLHIVEKWHEATYHNNPDGYLTRFYSTLDNNNQILLMEWVMNNYNGEKPLFS